ncbi:protein FAM81B [Aplochiton taeniatus]
MEGRLANQERTLSVLLEQALRIKDEVALSVQFSQGSVQAEVSSRRLLESHIHTITHIVSQLSANIQVLESQIAQRDSVTSETSVAVQSLDHKNMAGIGDLRGRVARCDASIAKLSGDMSSRERELLRLQQEVTELRSALEVRLKEMELKLIQAVGKLEASLAEKIHSQSGCWSELQSQVKLLEASIVFLKVICSLFALQLSVWKLKLSLSSGGLKEVEEDSDRLLILQELWSSGGLKEVMEDSDRLREWLEQQLHSSRQANTQDGQRLQSALHDKLVDAEIKLLEQLRTMEARVEQTEGQLEKASRGHGDRLRRSENKLASRINSVEASFRQELQLMKQDYQEGFKSVHEAIDSLRQIGDTKAHLDKEKLQKDIRQIRRRMIGIRDL